MDFSTLLHVAKKNSEINKNMENRKYYSTKFSAPKKETREEKKLSDNIKKFLAKKDEEEREKAQREKQSREKLLAMRDEKSKNKIRKMLKVIKSANKSAIQDAIDNENTAITLQGPDQPDEDDYGYVSKEAAALYKQYMDKVQSMPEEEKFPSNRSGPRPSSMGANRDRNRECDEKNNSSVRKPSTTFVSSYNGSGSIMNGNHKPRRSKEVYDAAAEREEEERKHKEESSKKTKKSSAPILDFKELLKLAEKKQHEPVEIEVPEKKKEPERLLTKKEKRELEERQAQSEQRERKKRDSGPQPSTPANSNNKMPPNGRIPKLSSSTSTAITSNSHKPINGNVIDRKTNSSSEKTSKSPSSKLNSHGSSGSSNKESALKKVSNGITQSHTSSSSSQRMSSSSIPAKDKAIVNSKSSNDNSKIQKPLSGSLNNNVKLLSNTVSKTSSKSTPQFQSMSSKQPQLPRDSGNKTAINNVNRALPSKLSNKSSLNGGNAQSSAKTSSQSTVVNKEIKNNKTREFPPRDVVERIRQFPPPDMKRSMKPMKKPMKRRILDDEDEYDSELDDFIDDGPQDEQNDYSSYIKEIFGYDKSRYRDYEDDDAGMESSYAQQMKEEYVSKKIGLLEDLEDIRKEAEDKKRKMMMKKRRLK